MNSAEIGTKEMVTRNTPFCQVDVVDGKCVCPAPVSGRAPAKAVCSHREDLRDGISKPKSKWGELKTTPGLENAEQQ